MHFLLLIPLIVLILLRNMIFLNKISDEWVNEFQKDFQLLTCARQDVYRRNIAEAIDYLRDQYEYVDSDLAAEDLINFEDNEGCKLESFAIYREFNPKLPAIYPNWVFRETERYGGD